MPYESENERVADVEGESPLCWESEGILRPGTTIDLHAGCFEAMPLPEAVVVGSRQRLVIAA